jgi:hypothetical protein
VYSLHTIASTSSSPTSADSKQPRATADAQHSKPECNGYECVAGLYAQEAIDLLKQFYARGNDKGITKRLGLGVRIADFSLPIFLTH